MPERKGQVLPARFISLAVWGMILVKINPLTEVMMRHLFLATLFTLFISNTAFAKDGSSGCGPGWYVVKKNSLVSSALRGTTNGFLGPVVTLGMTFGTSQCSKHSIVKTEKKTIHYVTNNFYELQSEIAKGEGLFLSGLSETIGCKSDTQKTFNKELKNKFQEMYKSNAQTPENVLIKVYETILTNEELTRSCSLS